MTEATFLLRSESELLDAATMAITHARSLGVDQASALANEVSGINMLVREGEVVSAIRDGHQMLSVTVFDNHRAGQADVARLTPDAIRTAVERAAAIARQVQPDLDAGLPQPNWLALDGPDVALFAPVAIGAPDLAAAAVAVEHAALTTSAPSGIRVRVDGAGTSAHESRWARATTQGFARAASATQFTSGASVVADGPDGMTMDGWSSSSRQLPLLDTPEMVGTRAAAHAIAAIGARSLSTRTAPVMLDSRIAASLVGELAGALYGTAQYQRTSFLSEAIGTQALAPHVDLVEDAFEPYGLASSAWDSEGIAAPRRHVVAAGRIEGYFLNTLSARKLGLQPTGSADGMNNLTLSSRDTRDDDDLAGMLRRLGTGLLVTGFIGGGVDRTTGAWSKAATGFWVEDGEIAFPVQDVTVAGDLPVMLRSIRAIGNDVYRMGPIRSGSILLDPLRIAGR